MKPLAIDLFCGLGGWAEGFLDEGYSVIGLDIERHRYPRPMNNSSEAVKRPGMNWSDRTKRGAKDAMFNRPAELDPEGGWDEYPGQLVLQDVLTLHGSQFKDAAVIVASPPCQEFSYMAMPWKRAKQIARALRGEDEFPEGYTGSRSIEQLTALFDACFRIQREACEAAGRYIPLVVENVNGAQQWVGRSNYVYGSFHLWGDIPALMPKPRTETKNTGGSWFGQRDGKPLERNDSRDMRRNDSGDFTNAAATGGGWNHPGKSLDGLKFGGGWWHDSTNNLIRKASSRSSARKAASAQIAKIPFALAQHIARVYKPTFTEAVA